MKGAVKQNGNFVLPNERCDLRNSFTAASPGHFQGQNSLTIPSAAHMVLMAAVDQITGIQK